MSKKVFLFLVFIISLIYLGLRFWNLPQKLDFRLDQGYFLLEAKSTIESSTIRLLGPPTSKIFAGRSFFVGSYYYYFLGAVGKIFSWDPLLITQFFIIFEFIFYLFFIFFLYQKFNPYLVLLSFFCLSISPYFVAHSRFFWNPHLLIPLSILALYFLDKFLRTRVSSYLFLASIFWGLAFSCHYSAIFWLPVFIYYLHQSEKLLKFSSFCLLVSGVLIGDLPFFIFELRHQFYNLQTFIFVYTNSSDSSGLTSHYLVFPLLIFTVYGLILTNYKLLFTGIIFLVSVFQFYLYPNYPSSGAVPNWNYADQQQVANLIAQNCPKNFNLASTMQGDTRSYDLRLLLARQGCLPDGVEDYPHSQTLFLISPISRPPVEETVWEVTSLRPFTITSTTRINDFLVLHRLDRQ